MTLARAIERAIPIAHVANREDAHRFYVDFLGFEVAMDRDGMLMLRSSTVRTFAWATRRKKRCGCSRTRRSSFRCSDRSKRPP